MAHRLAQTEVTHGARTAFIDGRAGDRHADASLLRCRRWNEPGRTLAHCQVVLYSALSVRATCVGSGARVITFVVDTSVLCGAVGVSTTPEETHAGDTCLVGGAL